MDHAKNNVEYTELHLENLMKFGNPNLYKTMQELKNFTFPSNERIIRAEIELAELEKQKTRFLYNSKMQKEKINYKIKIDE